jgi:NAD(P)-dependent dehydrogenase (short-subunit alcohol dehydrogenase family)
MRVKNKIALVTGGSHDIGKNIALSLANKVSTFNGFFDQVSAALKKKWIEVSGGMNL